jgi:hypothetical protein
MDPVQSMPITARIVAGVPLFSSGLEDLARSAGLRVVPVDEEASITLRGPDDPPASRGIDVVVAASSATIIILEEPDLKSFAEQVDSRAVPRIIAVCR